MTNKEGPCPKQGLVRARNISHCYCATHDDAVMDERLHRALATVREMLADRGLEVDDLPFEVVQQAVQESVLSGKPTALHLRKAGVCVLMYTSDKFSRHDFSKLRSSGDTHRSVILIKNSRVLPTSLTQLQGALREEGRTLETFDLRELQYNVARHALVPCHRKITAAEADAVLTRYNARKSQLPTILRSDAMARYLGLVSGDVVEITRTSPAAGLHVLYRHCV